MKLEREYNTAKIGHLVNHSDILYWVSEDGCEECPVYDTNVVHYLTATTDTGELLGGFMFFPRYVNTFEMHTFLLPGECKKHNISATEAADSAAEWMLHHTHAATIVTDVPAFNKRALHAIAKSRVASQIGVIKRAFLKDGILHDVHIFSSSKE